MKYFYDIHYHAFDLSHANLSAFLNRILIDIDEVASKEKLEDLLRKKLGVLNKLLIAVAPYNLLANKIHQIILDLVKNNTIDVNRITNTLSMLDYPIEDHFLIVEYFLKSKDPIIKNSKVVINGCQFDKMVICPLLQDFGPKDFWTDTTNRFYNLSPQKPIIKQTNDILNAIKNFYSYTLVLQDNKLTKKSISLKEALAKEIIILPFMGINPQHYILDNSINPNPDTLLSSEIQITNLFSKYFSDYEKHTPDIRKEIAFSEKRIKKLREFKGDVRNVSNEKELTEFFFGVKVYPPLGFDPSNNLSKLVLKECIKYNLPVTTHCSDTGFMGYPKHESELMTSPKNHWADLLQIDEFAKLRLNYAHMGYQYKSNETEWRDIIWGQISERKEKNIYTDISSIATKSAFYNDLIETLKTTGNYDDCSDNILFGSDFVINLLKCESYNTYLKYLNDSDEAFFEKICCVNPEKFLFGI